MSALTNLPFSISNDLFSAVRNQTRTCAVCKETKTERRWYKDPQDPTAFRCAACYMKAGGGVTRTCAVCKKTKTERRWYKDLEDPTAFRCDACYRRAKDAITHVCAVCHKTKIERTWYKDLEDPTVFRCDSCYRSTKETITRTCAVCQETKTEKNWYRDSRDPTAFRCMACYQRAYYDNRKKRGLDEQPLSDKRGKSMPPSLPSEEEEWDLPLPESPGLFLPLLASPLPESDDPFGNLDGLL